MVRSASVARAVLAEDAPQNDSLGLAWKFEPWRLFVLGHPSFELGGTVPVLLSSHPKALYSDKSYDGMFDA